MGQLPGLQWSPKASCSFLDGLLVLTSPLSLTISPFSRLQPTLILGVSIKLACEARLSSKADLRSLASILHRVRPIPDPRALFVAQLHRTYLLALAIFISLSFSDTIFFSHHTSISACPHLKISKCQ